MQIVSSYSTHKLVEIELNILFFLSKHCKKFWPRKGNQYGGKWRTKTNAQRYHSIKTKTTWNQRRNHDEDRGGNEAVGSYVHISL